MKNNFALPCIWLQYAGVFPGKKPTGGDRVPSPEEMLNCSAWLKRELDILQPNLVISVGKLAIAQFLPLQKLDQIIGRKFEMIGAGYCFDVIALPHRPEQKI